MMKNPIYAALLLLLGLLLLVPQAEHPNETFEAFKTQNGRRYLPGQEEYRRRIFIQNLAKIEKHNASPARGYDMGVTPFADMSFHEFSAIHLNLKFSETHEAVKAPDVTQRFSDDPVDWTDKVAPVKDQGQCGSSWAFGAIGAVEGLLVISGKADRLDLSEQELLECSGSYGNQGCNGGWMNKSFQYIADHKIHETVDYPYTSKQGRIGKCQDPEGRQWSVSGYKNVDYGNCQALEDAIRKGPVALAIDASKLYLYKGGIFPNSQCGTRVNHGSMLVGSTQDYWKIKEAWSVNFGEQGFVRLEKGNTCGLCNGASYPTA